MMRPQNESIFMLNSEILTLIYPFYNSQDALKRQIDAWKNYPEKLRKQVRFVLVDDCSDAPTDFHIDFSINLTCLRVIDDIDWNQPGAKNLGFKFALSPWAFFSDIDHVLNAEMCERLINLNKQKGIVYFFQRIDDEGEAAEPHPNSFLIHKDDFKTAEGYDEDFCGHYGYDDLLFKEVLQRLCTLKTLDNVSLITSRLYHTSTLNRDTRHNRKLFKKKRVQLLKGKYFNKNLLRFNWEIMDLLHFQSML